MSHDSNSGPFNMYGTFYRNDLIELISYYSRLMPGYWYSIPNENLITADLLNGIRNSVLDYAASNGYTTPDVPDTFIKNTLLKKTSWGETRVAFNPNNHIYVLDKYGTYQFDIPTGANAIRIYTIIAGGGAGGSSNDHELCGFGGSGGSGGWYTDITVPITANATITYVEVGKYGLDGSIRKTIPTDRPPLPDYGSVPEFGGDSYITFNNDNTKYGHCTGGGAGGSPLILKPRYRKITERNYQYYSGDMTLINYDPYEQPENWSNVKNWREEDMWVHSSIGNDRYGFGGIAGTPNGIPGRDGELSKSPYNHSVGYQGANCIINNIMWGEGGTWYDKVNNNVSTYEDGARTYDGRDATGYGAGGGGAGMDDGRNPHIWYGGSGSSGYCKFGFIRI